MTRKLRILITLDRSKEFLKILHDERGREVDKSYIDGFSKKKINLELLDHFGTKNCTSSQLWIGCKNLFAQ